MLSVGKIVARRSYNQDLFMKIIEIKKAEKIVIAVLGGAKLPLVGQTFLRILVIKTEK
jgi:hypothetical protein